MARVAEFCHRDIEIVQNTRCIEEWSGLCTSSTLTRDIEEFEADFDIYWEKDSNSPEDWILYINDQTQVYEIPPCNLDSFQNIDFEREAGGELSGGGKKKRNS